MNKRDAAQAMKRKIPLRRWLIGAVLVVATAVALWLLWPKPAAPSYRTAVIDRGHVERTIVAAGRLRATRTVEVGAEVSGLVSAVHVDINSTVSAGQALAAIEPTRLDAAVRQSDALIGVAQGGLAEADAAIVRERANLREAEQKLARATYLADRGLASAAALDTARTATQVAGAALNSAIAGRRMRVAEFDGAVARREDARSTRARATIISPIDGVVISRTIDPGQTLAASFQTPKLFEIAADLTDMRMEVSVNEADIADVRVGQKVRFTVDAYPEERFFGEVLQVQPQATEVDNVVAFQVVVAAPNPDRRLRPGMSTTAEIITQSKASVIRVPAAAAVFRPPVTAGKTTLVNVSIRPSPRLTGGQPTPHRRVTRVEGGTPSPTGDYVWRLSNGPGSDLVRVPVRFGVRGDQWIEIASGDLKVGDAVAIGRPSTDGRP